MRLLKALYGLKQSPQLFNKALTQFFELKCGMKRATSETSMYYKRNIDGKSGFLLVLVEVDDLVITGDERLVNNLRQNLLKEYSITQFEPINSFLGINIRYDIKAGQLTMDVANKIDALFLEKPRLQNIGSNNIPMAVTLPDRKKDKIDPLLAYLSDPKVYASIVGTLIYLAITCRPDISHAVGRCSRGMHSPSAQHVLMLRTLLQYLNSHRNYKLSINRYNNPIRKHLQLYAEKDPSLISICKLEKSKWLSDQEKPTDPLFGNTDADFASKHEPSRRSTTGFIFFFLGNTICWKSKLQPLLATSTHEAELIALNVAAQEAIFLRKLITEIRTCITGFHRDLPPTKILCDNMGAVHTATNPSSSGASKHIELRYLKIREYQETFKLLVKHIDGVSNIADMFTKPLPAPAFNSYCISLGMILE